MVWLYAPARLAERLSRHQSDPRSDGVPMSKGWRKNFQWVAGLGVLALILLAVAGNCDDAPISKPTAGKAEPSTPQIIVVTATPAPTAMLTRTARPTATPSPTPTKTPTPTIYTVQEGDNVSAIADRFGVELDALIAANEIDDPNLITVGTVLQIPNQGATAEASSSATRRPTRVFTVRPVATTVDCESGTAVYQYISSVIAKFSPIAIAIDAFAVRVRQSAKDPAYYLADAEWRSAVVLQMATIRAFSNEILALRPPSALQQVHDYHARAATAFFIATQRVAEGLARYDRATMAEAQPHFTSGADYLRGANTAFHRIC